MDNQATNSNVAFWGCLISMLVIDNPWGKVIFAVLMLIQFVMAFCEGWTRRKNP